jgi:hypothetical protein
LSKAEIASNFLERDRGKRGSCAPIFPVLLRRVRQVCPEEYQHIRVELPMEGDAVEARCIDAYLRNFLCQRGRTGRQEREVPGVWNDAIFVF